MSVWRSVTDREYNRPLIEGGSGAVFEAIEQAAHVFAQVSLQVERNTQAMYILPWSGQTEEPSSGERFATVELTIERTAGINLPITFMTDVVKFEHRLNDWGENGGVDVSTKRNYLVQTRLTLLPGQAGPMKLQCIAERPGFGFNHPLPDQIKTPLQPGVGFSNAGASVVVGAANTHRVVCALQPEVPIVEHVGQYLQFTSGANLGRVMLIIGVESGVDGVHGGVFGLEATGVLRVSSVTGTWSDGHLFEQAGTGAVGEVRAASSGLLVFVRLSGTFNASGAITSEYGATANVDALELDPLLTAESASAAWRILDWREDLGFTFTNEASPSGGRSAMLDELGRERNVFRSLRESDDQYRKRVHTPADVVSPNAIVRTANRILLPYNAEACLREVGYPKLFGVFFDSKPSTLPFAFDLDLQRVSLDSPTFAPNEPWEGERLFFTNPTTGIVTIGRAVFRYPVTGNATKQFSGIARVSGPPVVINSAVRGELSGYNSTVAAVLTAGGLNPAYRFFVMLNLLEFRGFFLLGVPRLQFDAWGTFYDEHPDGATDTRALSNFYDGEATGARSLYSRIYNAVYRAKAAGVRFDLYIEDFGCV